MWLALGLAFFLYLVSSCTSYELLDQISGGVNGGDVVVYTAKKDNLLLLCLDSTEGDADLYVSRSHSSPGPEHYHYAATSTGIDIVVVPRNHTHSTAYLGVQGHVRYNHSLFTLYLLVPSSDDLKAHQVWEYDYETMRHQLIISVDPLSLANDASLHRTLEELMTRASPGKNGPGNHWVGVAMEWVLWTSFKLLEIAFEILV